MTGSVTLENIRLSLVAGTAFADFSEAGVLTNAIGGKLTLTDSAGKKAIGYIKAAGTGETLGDELITNGGFDSDADGWSKFNCTLASIAGGESGNCLELTRVTGTAQSAYQTIASEGKLYIYSAYVKSGTSGAGTARILMNTGGISTLVTSPSWQQLPEKYYTATSLDDSIYLMKYNSTDGTMLFDGATCKQILAPSSTGVTITSTPGGTTYNWESVDANFNYNDSNGYTYSIDFSRGWGVKRPRGIRRWTDEYGNERVMYY